MQNPRQAAGRSVLLMSVVACGFGVVTAIGCSDDAETNVTSTSSTGSTGAGGATSSGSGGMSTSQTSAVGTGGSAATTSGTGGEGGGQTVSCPSGALTPGAHATTISFGGRNRDYTLVVPSSYDNTAAIPVVFDLHGYSSSASQQGAISGWQALAEANGFAVVRPDGFGALKSWNAGDFCCGQASSQSLDDVGLMRAIAAEVAGNICVDDKRVYASGLSNGGGMAHRLACEAADLFAAVAPVAYPLALMPATDCQPSRPISVFYSHGTSDLVVPYNGTVGVAAAQDSHAYWGQVNNCATALVRTYDKGNSHCDAYQGCDAGVEAVLCTIDGPHVLYNNSDDVPIAAEAWTFFQAHPMP